MRDLYLIFGHDKGLKKTSYRDKICIIWSSGHSCGNFKLSNKFNWQLNSEPGSSARTGGEKEDGDQFHLVGYLLRYCFQPVPREICIELDKRINSVHS